MPWTVAFHQAFEAEFDQLPLEVREALAATAGLLQLQGPLLGSPMPTRWQVLTMPT